MRYDSITNTLYLHCRGRELLSLPRANKGTAFTSQERQLFALEGHLPASIFSLQEQVELEWQKLQKEQTSLEKYRFLRHLQDHNETLFYALCGAYPREILPLIYTPTVGEGCQEFSRIAQSFRGLFLSIDQKERLETILRESEEDPDVILVTDGERVLGLGDLGVGGMGISIGKLALYTVFGGINPHKALPVVLDVGTNNSKKLTDPFYLGLKQTRPSQKEYDDFIEAFVKAVKNVFPRALLQWEDFGKDNARRVLDRYRKEICSFNDDIQGTAGVALAALLKALERKKERAQDQVYLFYGAGSAAMGIADLIVSELVKEGLSPAEAYRKCYILNSKGLLVEGNAKLMPQQKPYARPQEEVSEWQVREKGSITLHETVHHAKPTVLIGTSADPKAFSQQIVEEIALHCRHPIIFPLSNPNSACEADPADLIRWTNGCALVATGSPYPEANFEGKTCTFSQCNNSYVFPGLGLAIVACRLREVPDQLFTVAARVLAYLVDEMPGAPDALLPPMNRLREVSYHVAIAVGKAAVEMGICEQLSDAEIETRVKAAMWTPAYPTLSFSQKPVDTRA